jgi:hypothetical protein
VIWRERPAPTRIESDAKPHHFQTPPEALHELPLIFHNEQASHNHPDLVLVFSVVET